MERTVWYNGDEITLKDLSEKLEGRLEKTAKAVKKHAENEKHILVNGEKYLVILPTDIPLNSAEFSYKMSAAIAQGYNVLNLFPESEAKAEKTAKKGGNKTAIKGGYIYRIKDIHDDMRP